MTKSITEIAALWEEEAEEIYQLSLAAAGGELSNEVDKLYLADDLERVLDDFIYEHDLFDVDAPDAYFEMSVQDYLEGHFGRVDTCDSDEFIGEIGDDFLESLPNAVIEDGVYAVMDTDGLNDHIAVVLRERLSGDYYDCDEVCARDGECDHAELRSNAERGAA